MTLPFPRRAARTMTWLGLLACAAVAQAQPLQRPILSTANNRISARLDGPPCGELIRLVFNGADAQDFMAVEQGAASLMNNVTELLRGQCPSVARVSTRGTVAGKVVYTGVAEAATDWEVVELGSGSGSALLSGRAGSGPSAARRQFATDPGLVPAARFVEWVRATPTLCVRPSKNTCAGLNQFEVRGDGSLHLTATYQMDANGAMAQLSYPARPKDEFFCSNPADAKVSVMGGKLTAAGRAEMQSLLLERVQAAGQEVCTGYLGSQPNALQTETFGSNGASQAERTQATLTAQRMPLRYER